MKILKESCFALSTKLLRKNLQKARNKEVVQGEYLNFIHNGKPSVLFYSTEESCDGNTYLVVDFNGEPQKILLFERELTYGTRTYLTCGCGHKTNALYLKNIPGSTFFACFKCHCLRYKSTTINSRSDHGRMLYQQSKRLALLDMRESIPRPLYRSKWTKRFQRFLKLCNQSGLFNQVRDAQKTIEMIKEYQSQ
ncbi:MAG: hypothetical protein WC793_02570 [Candidatus Paceibacterota bacterium]|jgi:hypothetical protein